MLAYAYYESDMRILRYAKTLSKRGNTVDVISLRRAGTPAFEVMQGINVYRIQHRRRDERTWFDYLARITRFMFVAALVLSRKHLAKSYDVIHVHSVPDFLVFAAFLPKLLGAKVILDIHDILPELFASKFGVSSDSLMFRVLLLAESVSIDFSDHVIIANDLWHERLVRRAARADQCTTIINYPDSELFAPRGRSKCEGGSFCMVYPGTLNEHQGLDIAVRAVGVLADTMPDGELHIYGEGPAKPGLIALRDELQLSGRVFFHDFVPCEHIAEIMALADVAIVPKRASSGFGNEAMSTKIMEFMCVGVPVIVSRTTVDSYYHDESRVRFFESENVTDLATAMMILRHDPDLRRLLASNATAYVRKNNWLAKEHLYVDLLDGLRSTSARTVKVLSEAGN